MSSSEIENRDKLDLGAVNDDFTFFGKVHRDTAADVGLHLTDSPVGTVGVADEHPGLEERVQAGHEARGKGDREQAMEDTSELSALIGSRICHDLISPIGAIGNGVELLTMTGSSAAPEIALIAESVENASARIRFFRVAFGAAAAGAMLGEASCRSILRDMYRDSRLRIDWKVAEDVSRREAKVAFLLIQCLEHALPVGGRILITRTGDRWHLQATGERLKVDEAIWSKLSGPGDLTDIVASEVQFALAPAAARRLGREITLLSEYGSVTVSF